MLEPLVARGADLGARDARDGGVPADWVAHGGAAAARARLDAAASAARPTGEGTVKVRAGRVYQTLGVQHRTEALAVALRRGRLRLPGA